MRNLFHPVDPAEIASAAANGRRLFARTGRAEAFARLLPWATLNTLVTSDALATGRVKVARQGRPVPVEMMRKPGAANRRDWIAADAIQSLCDQGASLVLDGVERELPAIAAMNAMVERYLGCDTITNAYASFNRDSAFNAHWDAHNVLILQLHGRKRWWCYGQVAENPTKAKVFSRLDGLPPPEWEAVLEPGDILFVPRGDVHRAAVEGANSLHLTVTMTPPSGADLLTWLVESLATEPAAWRYLPRHADPAVQAAQTETLRQLVHRFADTLDPDAFFAAADLARPPAKPLNIGLSQELTPATEVQPALRRRIPLRGGPGTEARVQIGQTSVALSAEERDVLAALLEADTLTMAQLATMFPAIDMDATVARLARTALVFLFPPA